MKLLSNAQIRIWEASIANSEKRLKENKFSGHAKDTAAYHHQNIATKKRLIAEKQAALQKKKPKK